MVEGATPLVGEARPRGQETRTAIREAAIRLFAELGYNATTMRGLAAAASVQPAAIYHWYENKEAILVELQDDFMRDLTERVEAGVAAHSRPAFRLAAAVREHVVFHGENRLEAFVTDSEIRALTPGPRAALIAKRDAYQERFGSMIRDGIRDGELHSSEPYVATYAILLQCTGVALWFQSSGPLGLGTVAEVHVELVLGSLGAGRELTAAAITALREAAPAGEAGEEER